MLSERTIFDLIGLIYDAASDSTRWPAFLEKFRQASKASGTNLFVQDLRSQELGLTAAVGMDPSYQRSYESYYKTRNVYLIQGNRLLRTASVRLSPEMCPDAIALRSEFYNDWIAPQRQRHGMLGVVFRQQSLTSMCGAIRAKSAEPFGPEERSLLRALMPHLQRAISLHRWIADLEAHKAAAADALNHWSLGVILLDNYGRILLLNRKAEEIVSQRDGLALGADGLHATLPRETSALRGLIRDAIVTQMGKGGNSGGAIAVSRVSCKRSLNLVVAPVFSQTSLAASKRATAAVFVTDPEEQDKTNEVLLQHLYSLTPAEALLAGLLASGEDLKRAAETLRVSMNTVRTQLKKVFEKTGTRRQAELVRLLLTSPAQIRLKA